MSRWNETLEKWNTKMGPAMEKTGRFCRSAGKKLSVVMKYAYRFRGIVLSVPVALGAVVLAFFSGSRLPDMVQVTSLRIDSGAEDALFGFLQLGMTEISRSSAIMWPLLITSACIALTICSRRTLYPWLVSLFSLCLPLLFLLTNMPLF